MYGCLNANLSIPAAIAIRTTFDRAAEILNIDSSLTFNQKLNALVDCGRISEGERDLLEVMIDAGSAAAHRGWKPKPDELETQVTLLENFLHRTFVLGEAARNLKGAIPSRPSRPPNRRPQ